MGSGQQSTEQLSPRFVIQPNGSMTTRLAAGFFAAIAMVSGAVAAGFWAIGLWPIASYTGLELGALALALWHCARHNRYREVISVGKNLIRVETGLGRPTRVRDFDRYWTRVELEPPRLPNHPSRLWMCSRGEGVELGVCLTDDERRSLAERLRDVVRPAAA